MAHPNGTTTDAVISAIEQEPYAYEFYAALRLVQKAFSGHPRIGRSWSPSQDPVRLRHSPGLDFAPAAVESLKRPPGKPPALYSRHFGLFGPNGPLPMCLTEYARDRLHHHGDRTFTSFCDVFHHRMLSFLFRAWADARKSVDADRPADNSWPKFIGSLIGLGMNTLEGRDSIPDQAKFFFAGRLVHHARNSEGLEGIIQDYFGVITQVHTFIGRWLALPPEAVCMLGCRDGAGVLGEDIIVGTRIWTAQTHFRLRLGPMRLPDFERLLPNGSSFQRLRDWIRQYIGELFSWDAQMILKNEEVPSIQLGTYGRLGWTTWLKSLPFTKDAEDLVLTAT